MWEFTGFKRIGSIKYYLDVNFPLQ